MEGMNNATSNPTDNTLDNLLGMVDVASAPASGKPASMTAKGALDAVPLSWRTRILAAGKQALFQVLADGMSQEDAVKAAEAAASAEYDRIAVSVSAPAVVVPPAPPIVRGETVIEAGRVRSLADVTALRAAGFAMRETIYERGTAVIDTGVKNAQKARREYDRLPLVSEVCDALAAQITAENRRIVPVLARDVSMEPTGRIVLGDAGALDITENGFDGLCEMLGFGGARYLRERCPAALRAHNVNAQRALLISAEDARAAEARAESRKVPTPRSIAARVRDRAPTTKDGVVVDPGGAEVFAAVSTGFPTFDADQIAEAFKLAMPADARGSARYDAASTGTRFEALFHTTVAPEDFVCGEVFRTGIRVRANDSGDGSIVVRAVAFQNLCLNLIIIDRAGREIARIPHVGTVEALRAEFVKALAKATAAIAPFMKQWGYACREDIIARLTAEDVKLPSDPAEVMRGIFAGLLSSRRVRFPRLAGKSRQDVLDALMAAWRADVSSATAHHRGVTRAAVVNAVTRAAQEWIHAADPWATDSIELDAAKLLWGQGGEKPAPLVFVDLNDAGEVDFIEAPAAVASA